MCESPPTPCFTSGARCTHMPRTDIDCRHRERCRNALHSFWCVVRVGVGTADTKLAEIVLSPTAHRIVCKNCTGIGAARGQLSDRATHIHEDRVRLVCSAHANLALPIATPAPHGSCTRENPCVFCTSHHFRWRRNRAVSKHSRTHRQQALGEPRMIRAAELPLIITTPTPHGVVALDGTRKSGTRGNTAGVVNA
jgi:hypothetical protein